jgi:hypothetical protein
LSAANALTCVLAGEVGLEPRQRAAVAAELREREAGLEIANIAVSARRRSSSTACAWTPPEALLDRRRMACSSGSVDRAEQPLLGFARSRAGSYAIVNSVEPLTRPFAKNAMRPCSSRRRRPPAGDAFSFVRGVPSAMPTRIQRAARA